MSDLSRRHQHQNPMEGLKDISSRLYKEVFGEDLGKTNHANVPFTKTQDTQYQGLLTVDADKQGTVVHFKAGDTLWDLAEKKYKGTYSLGAIYEANHLTPTIVEHFGERKFIAPTCYVGYDYVLPAQSELPALDLKFKQRMGIEAKGKNLPENTEKTCSSTSDQAPSTAGGCDHIAKPKPDPSSDLAGQIEQYLTFSYKQAKDFLGKEWKLLEPHGNRVTPSAPNNSTNKHWPGVEGITSQPTGTSFSSWLKPYTLTEFFQTRAHSVMNGLVSTYTNEISGNGLLGKLFIKSKDGLHALADSLDSMVKEMPKEVPPPQYLPILPGSYYRKLASSFDPEWQGIKTTITLGTPIIDSQRRDKATHKPQDGISVYLGGNANGQEIDAGLTWEATVDKYGNVSQEKRAWRPFWFNSKWGNAPAKEQYYWQPGDTVEMSVVRSKNPGWLTLSISDPGPNPRRSFVTEIKAESFQPGTPCQFKAVTSIDQKAGQPVVATNSSLIGTNWQKISLQRGPEQFTTDVPLTSARRAQLISHEKEISVRQTGNDQSQAGEVVNIHCVKKQI